jgi:hypothetical protein
MTDFDASTRIFAAAVIALNVLLLVGERALLTRPARLGARASFAGYACTVISWLVLAIGCGIEYYNARCDAVVTPLVTAGVIVSLVSLPIGRICGLFVRSHP